jgi:hypothetical protein
MSDQTNGPSEPTAPPADAYAGKTYEECEPFKFRIKQKDGAFKYYELREMGGTALDTWTAYQASLIQVDRKGNRRPKENMDGFHAQLICLCCYDENGSPVPFNVVRNWKGPIQADLFDRCQKMNGLDDEAEERAKKA